MKYENRLSLRGAERQSNLGEEKKAMRLLRYARNDGSEGFVMTQGKSYYRSNDGENLIGGTLSRQYHICRYGDNIS